MNKVIKSFEDSPEATCEVFHGEAFPQRYPSLRMDDSVEGCFDPTGGVLMADKALKAIQVRSFFTDNL